MSDPFTGSPGEQQPEAPAGDAWTSEALRETWSRYPVEWKQNEALRLGFDTLGDEWGGPHFADLIVELVEPYLGGDVDVLELGCGGGKFSRRLAPRCRSLLCSDISAEMIAHTRAMLRSEELDGNVDYKVLNGVDFAGIPDESVDFIFSYDVQLHLQRENVFSYLRDARRVLRDGGIAMLHQVKFSSDGGIRHFLGQYGSGGWMCDPNDSRHRGYVYFMSSDDVHTLAALSRLVVDDIVGEGPPGDSLVLAMARGRDLIAFLRLMPSRLRNRPPSTVRLVRAEGSHLYAMLDGYRAAFLSDHHFIAAGFRIEDVELLSQEELESLPASEPLAPWE